MIWRLNAGLHGWKSISFPASLNSLNLHTKSRYQKSKFHYCFFPIICCFVAWKTFLIIVLVCQVPQLGCQDNSDPLSSAEDSLCCKEAGVKENESARGTIPTIPYALAIFRLLLFLLGYPVGVSAVKRDSVLQNSHLTPLKTSDPLYRCRVCQKPRIQKPHTELMTLVIRQDFSAGDGWRVRVAGDRWWVAGDRWWVAG